MDRLLSFLTTRTPGAWCELAIENISTLLLDHAALELKAAHQAQQTIWKYGGEQSEIFPDPRLQEELVHQMSRLAREELRHFEQVIRQLQIRGIRYRSIAASGYASALHKLLRSTEPDRLIDTLIVGALIEARSCERFYVLVEPLSAEDPELADFYGSLMRSEARHFEVYLSLVRKIGPPGVKDRIDELREAEGLLVFSSSPEFRFHSGVPTG